MCEFNYHYYEACCHRFIEIVTHCANALWKAGMNGELRPCREVIYTSHLINNMSPSKFSGTYSWKGRSGFCRKCEIDFEVKYHIHSRLDVLLSTLFYFNPT